MHLNRRRHSYRGSSVAAEVQAVEPRTLLSATTDTSIPQILNSAAERLSTSPTLEWEGVSNATEYEVWFRRVGDDSAPISLTTMDTSHRVSSLPVGFYNLWVRAKLAADGYSPWGGGRFVVDAQPVLSIDAEDGLTISWDALDGVTEYQIWANNRTTQNNGFINTNVTGTKFVLETPGFGQHQFWVRALGPNGFRGQWSAVGQHYVGVETQNAPRATFSSRPELQWNSLEGADQFRVWISGPQGFRLDQPNVTGTSFVPNEDLAAGRYRWWVMPQTAGGRYGKWSSAGVIDIGGGAAGIEFVGETWDSSPILRWQPTEGAASYEVLVVELADPDGVLRETGITSTELQMPVMLDGDYHVWVRPTDASGQAGLWSRVFEYRLTTATVDINVTVGNEFFVTFASRAEFSWSRPAGAATFDLVYTDGNAEHEVFGLTTTTYMPPVPPGGMWGWSVRARTESGAAGPWTEIAAYFTDGKTIVDDSNPVTHETRPVFAWFPVDEADRYSLAVIHRETGETVLRNDQITQNFYRPASPLAPGIYRIWVKALSNSAPTIGTWSDPMTLTIEADA